MYIPPARYPKGANSIKMYPELFSDIDIRDFALSLGKRFWDFIESSMFLYASPQEKNYGSKLIMLLSAIERTIAKGGVRFQEFLRSAQVREQLVNVDSDKELRKRLDNLCKEYNQKFGSMLPLTNFFQSYLTKREKISLVKGIKKIYTFTRRKVKGGEIFTPKFQQERITLTGSGLNKALTKVVKGIIYNIRNNFIHRASYFPFPDYPDNKNAEKRLLRYTKWKKGRPKEEWLILISFESLHKITRNAFVRYWKEEYKRATKNNLNS